MIKGTITLDMLAGHTHDFRWQRKTLNSVKAFNSEKTAENPRSLENMSKEKRYEHIILIAQFYAAIEWEIWGL